MRSVVRPLSSTRPCRVWLVSGPGGTAHVLRIPPPGTSAARTTFVTAVHRRLSEAGLAPRLVGTYGRCLPGGRALTVTEYLAGEANGPGRAGELGRMLGAVHRRLDGPVPAGDGVLIRLPEDPAVPLRAAIAAHPGGPEATEEVDGLRWKLAQARRLDGSLRRQLPRLPRAVIHGDYHPGNVLFEGDRAVAVVDFDRACVFPRGYELMRGLLHCTGRAGPWRPAVRRFLDAYAAEATLSRLERATMVDLFWTVQLADTHCLLPEPGVGPTPDRREFRERRLAILRLLEAHHGELRDALEATPWR